MPRTPRSTVSLPPIPTPRLVRQGPRTRISLFPLQAHIYSSLAGYASGDEYEILLRYVNDEAEKANHKEDRNDDDGEGKMKRVWYMPWKQVRVASEKEKKVSWAVEMGEVWGRVRS